MENLKKLTESLPQKGRSSEYSHARTGGYVVPAAVPHNRFREDPVLSKALRRLLSSKDYDRVAADLDRLSERLLTEINTLALQTEKQEPILEQYNAFGERVDNLIVGPAWTRLKQIAAEEGIVGIGYDPNVDAVTRRLHQFAKLYLFTPSSGLVGCPLAMSDGACRTFNSLGLTGKDPVCTLAYERLLSRNPSRAWTAGQWMTEKKGGSDVAGGCDTYAVHQQGRFYKLYGYKWFSSAVDADIALTLARVEDGQGNAGTRGLSLFFIHLRDANGKLNGIEMVRLKNKLGTRQLPTAELLLDGTIAEKLSDDGRGVSAISSMLNITRIYNATSSTAAMRLVISLSRDYATRRNAFGQKLKDWPLHIATLAQMEVLTRASLLLVIESARLLGIEVDRILVRIYFQESGRATETELVMLRLITPITKLYTAKLCIPVISEGLESFGGLGYLEDSGLPPILRNAQVTPIWEGTTNVLSLDVLRVFATKNDVLGAFTQHVNTILPQTAPPQLTTAKERVLKAVDEITEVLAVVSDFTNPSIRIDMGARHLSMSLGRILSGALLIQHAADSTATKSDVEAANRFCMESKLVDAELKEFLVDRGQRDTALVYENYLPAPKSKI